MLEDYGVEVIIRYRGALYDNIYLFNGYRIRKHPKHGNTTAVADVEGLHEVIFKAVFYNNNFRNEERNIFEMTDNGWALR